jgi:N-acetylmuramoyl-L-alanine amidase
MEGLLDGDSSLQIKALEGLIQASSTLGIDASRYKNALKILQPKAFTQTSHSVKKRRKEAKKPLLSKEYHRVIPSKKVKLVASKVEGEHLILQFSAPITSKSVKTFIMKHKKYHLYVYDVSPVYTPFSIKRYRGRKGFKEIRIAQYNPKKIRIVIETKDAYQPNFQIIGKKLMITLPIVSSIEKRAYPTNTQPNFRTYTVVIDPGHGGKDGGAIGYQKRREKDAVLAISQALQKELKKRGFRAYLTRSRDEFIPLKQRTHFANQKRADFFISIHANAAPSKRYYLKSRGIETYFLSWQRSGRAKEVAELENRADLSNKNFYTKDTYLNVLNREKIIASNKLAIDLQKQILSSLKREYSGIVDNGVRDGPFWVLVGAQMPAVLIEVGYITHPVEGKRLFNAHYRRRLVEGIANGIESYIYHNSQ